MLLALYVCVIEAGGAGRKEEELLLFVIINHNGKFAKKEGGGEEQGLTKAAPKTEVNGEKKESKIPSGVSTNQTRELRAHKFSVVVSYFLFRSCFLCCSMWDLSSSTPPSFSFLRSPFFWGSFSSSS